MTRNLLLISNSKSHGGGFLNHAEQQIRDVLDDAFNVETVLFIPYARPGGRTLDEYTTLVRERFKRMGFDVHAIHWYDSPQVAVNEAQAIFVGGGNTWELLRNLRSQNLLSTLREAVESGTPYIGSSAGANVAGLTIGNTNDMPAAESDGRDALGLVPFNINPHYRDIVEITPDELEAVLRAAPQLKVLLDYKGETREERIKEYHALGNPETVVALREGTMLRVTGNSVYLLGDGRARIFTPEGKITEHQSGERLDFLVSPQPSV